MGWSILFLNVTRDKEKEWFVGRVGHYHDFFPGVINNKCQQCPFQQDTLVCSYTIIIGDWEVGLWHFEIFLSQHPPRL